MAELYFCTVCGVSVPQAELDSGAAVQEGERSVCPECLAVLRGSVGGGRGGGGASGPLGLVVALLAVAGVVWVWLDAAGAQERLRGELATALETQGEIFGDHLDDAVRLLQSEIQRESGLTVAQIEELGDRLRSVEEAMDDRLRGLQQETEQLGQLALEIEAIGRRLGKAEAEVTLAAERQGEQRGVMEALRNRVDTLEASQRELAARGPAAGSESAAEEFSPAVAGLVRQLRSADQDERLDALEKLSTQEDPRLVPHLLPLLSDPYEFNRFYAAKTLGDWRAKAAVPHLIESLLDEIGFVRQAAVQSLRLVTGQNFRFQHDGEQADRQQAYQSWKTWWNTNGKSFLEG